MAHAIRLVGSGVLLPGISSRGAVTRLITSGNRSRNLNFPSSGPTDRVDFPIDEKTSRRHSTEENTSNVRRLNEVISNQRRNINSHFFPPPLPPPLFIHVLSLHFVASRQICSFIWKSGSCVSPPTRRRNLARGKSAITTFLGDDSLGTHWLYARSTMLQPADADRILGLIRPFARGILTWPFTIESHNVSCTAALRY